MVSKIFKKRKQIVCLFLFPLFLAWVNSTAGFPLLSMIMGSSHNVHLTSEHGEIHLNLGHHEVQVDHELRANNFHEHEDKNDLPHIDFDIFSSGQSSHPSHEFHISALVQQSIATVKTDKIPEISTPLAAIDWSMQEYFDLASNKSSLQFFSEISSTLFSLRKVVLLI